MGMVTEHYKNLLAKHYVWLFGGYEYNLKNNKEFFDNNSLTPSGSKNVIDLGCGPGFHIIPLAELGFNVKGVDSSPDLLKELNTNKKKLNIQTVQSDIINYMKSDKVEDGSVELILCMGDTITHLDSKKQIENLITMCYNKLETSGKLILSFRDYTVKLEGADKIIPVKSDDKTIFTCILEFGEDHVDVYDTIYIKKKNFWEFRKSGYKKAIVPPAWMEETLIKVGFNLSVFKTELGMVTAIANKKRE